MRVVPILIRTTCERIHGRYTAIFLIAVFNNSGGALRRKIKVDDFALESRGPVSELHSHILSHFCVLSTRGKVKRIHRPVTGYMRVYYEQTCIYACKKKAQFGPSQLVISLSFAYCKTMSCTDSHVTPTIRMAFPLVWTSSNLKSLPAVAAKERVQVGTDLRRIERGGQLEDKRNGEA